MSSRRPASYAAIVVLFGFAASPVHAHFHLTYPDSWIVEDADGNPQKTGPCGPAATDSPMETGKVTAFKAGQKITVTWIDTIAHPGHFRIALAKNRSDLKDPDIQQDSSCMYDEKMVPMGPHDNVLDDGVAFRSAVGFNAKAGMMFSDEVTLPNEPCDNCTLQVMQVMEMDIQAISNCHYYHCANISITADGGGSAGSGTAGSAAGASAGAAGAAGIHGASAGGGGLTVSAAAGSGGTTAGSAGSSATTTTTGTAGKSGSTPTTGTTTSAQTGAAGTKSSAAGSPSPTTSSSGTTGAGTTTTPAASPAAKSGGCSVTHVASTSNGFLAFGMGALIAGAFARRSKKRSAQRELGR